MTMKIRITNEGPHPYEAQVVHQNGVRVVLQPGESTELYVWPEGGAVVITEVSTEEEPNAAEG